LEMCRAYRDNQYNISITDSRTGTRGNRILRIFLNRSEFRSFLPRTSTLSHRPGCFSSDRQGKQSEAVADRVLVPRSSLAAIARRNGVIKICVQILEMDASGLLQPIWAGPSAVRRAYPGKYHPCSIARTLRIRENFPKLVRVLVNPI